MSEVVDHDLNLLRAAAAVPDFSLPGILVRDVTPMLAGLLVAVELLCLVGAEVLGAAFLMELKDLGGRSVLAGAGVTMTHLL
jgi:adenine/guanine phosphoribosyltransferase-like PRPP-binding protein